MLKKYRPLLFLIVFYAAAALCVTLLLVFIYSALTGFQAPSYYRTVSNILFFEGMLAITFGAFVEFFVKARSPSILRSMMMPYEVFSKSFAWKIKDADAARMDEDAPGGWALIAIGVLIVIVSAAFAYISMK